jgi:hypothetical protein
MDAGKGVFRMVGLNPTEREVCAALIASYEMDNIFEECDPGKASHRERWG